MKQAMAAAEYPVVSQEASVACYVGEIPVPYTQIETSGTRPLLSRTSVRILTSMPALDAFQAFSGTPHQVLQRNLTA
jgi:hypothetical protein